MLDANKRKRLVKRRNGIKTKLIGTIVPVVIISIVAVMVVAFKNAQDSIITKTEALVQAEAQAGINEIQAWQDKNLAIMETITTTITDLKMEEEEILSYLGYNLERYEDYPNGMYITYEDDQVLDGAGWVPEGKATEGVWYTEGVHHESFLFGEPYMDTFVNEYVVTASKYLPAFDGRRDAVAAVDVSLRALTDTVSSMNIADAGDAFIVDGSTGMILAHKDAAMVGTMMKDASDSFYSEVMSDIEKGSQSAAEYVSADGTYITSILPIEKTNWYMVGRVSEEFILKDLQQMGRFMVFLAAAIVLVMIILIERLVAMIVTPINRLTRTIVTITQGDFTEDVKVKGKDEVAIMAAHMQQFLIVMRDMIGRMRDISDNLNIKASNSNSLSQELYKSAGSQSDSMEQMNTTVEELVRAITEIAENATSLAQIVSDTNDDGTAVMSTMQETRTAAEQGRKDMNHVNQAMGEIETSMVSLEESIQDVGTAAVKINEITNTIGEIAEETNLLALNATIEAARAGEAGRGFAVVASQIKKLAETSASAADEISQLIISVSELIRGTVSKSQNSMDEIKGSADLVNVAIENFNHIYESINNTNTIMEGMIVKIKEVDDVAASVAAITEEQSASAQEIEATTAEMTNLAAVVADNSKEVASDAGELTLASEDLKEQVSKFKIRE